MVPRPACWLVRAALVHLGVGATLGLWLLAAPVAAAPPPPPWLRILHVEVLLFGWLLQLAAGVAFWILPRSLHGGPERSPLPAAIVLALLNAGVILVAAGSSGALPAAWQPAGRAAELAAALTFAVHASHRLTVTPAVTRSD